MYALCDRITGSAREARQKILVQPAEGLCPVRGPQRAFLAAPWLVLSCLVFFIVVAETSCGGSSSDPTSPTPVPSMSRYPGMVGNWRGTLTVENVFGIQRIVTACDETWVVTTQIAGQVDDAEVVRGDNAL